MYGLTDPPLNFAPTCQMIDLGLLTKNHQGYMGSSTFGPKVITIFRLLDPDLQGSNLQGPETRWVDGSNHRYRCRQDIPFSLC